MQKRFRLRRRRDFQALLAAGRVYAGATLVGFARPSAGGRHGEEQAHPRVGVSVSRRIRGAVHRNRARRRLREAARLNLLGDDSPLVQGGKTYDVVLIARPAALTAPFADLLRDTRAFARRVPRTGLG